MATTPITTSAEDIDRLRLVLLRLARQIRTHSSTEITPSQLAVLATLARSGPLTVGQIAEAEQVKPPSVSKIVANLEATGFVTRESDPTDRRCVVIAATPDGGSYLEKARAAGRNWLAERVDELDADDHDRLGDALPLLERLLGGIE